MSAPLPLRAADVQITRTGLLGIASVVIATCSLAVTIAVSTEGGGSDQPAAVAGPRFATGITSPPAPDSEKPIAERRR